MADLTNLSEDQRATALAAFKWYLARMRAEYADAIEMSDPMASHIRVRRDILIDLIKTLDPEGPTP